MDISSDSAERKD